MTEAERLEIVKLIEKNLKIDPKSIALKGADYDGYHKFDKDSGFTPVYTKWTTDQRTYILSNRAKFAKWLG